MSKRLEKIRQRMEQLENQLKQEEMKERTRLRKIETRRKVLLGALVMEMMDKDATLKEDIHRRLESFLTRRIDREVFGFAGGKDPSAEPVDSQSSAA